MFLKFTPLFYKVMKMETEAHLATSPDLDRETSRQMPPSFIGSWRRIIVKPVRWCFEDVERSSCSLGRRPQKGLLLCRSLAVENNHNVSMLLCHFVPPTLGNFIEDWRNIASLLARARYFRRQTTFQSAIRVPFRKCFVKLRSQIDARNPFVR